MPKSWFLLFCYFVGKKNSDEKIESSLVIESELLVLISHSYPISMGNACCPLTGKEN
jgi:hypothetical protein